MYMCSVGLNDECYFMKMCIPKKADILGRYPRISADIYVKDLQNLVQGLSARVLPTHEAFKVVNTSHYLN